MREMPLVAVFVAICSLSVANAADPKPNVLFIAVDDLNDWISPLGGYPGCKTPNLERLAARGTTFTNSHCVVPACNPSRTALLTGIRPWDSGVYVNPQPWRPALPDAITLPQRFREANYQVDGAGKIFHGSYEDRGSWDDYLKTHGDPKPTKAVANDPHSRAGGIVFGKLDVDDEAMKDYRVASYTIERLSQPNDKPMFLACGIYRPHMPWQVPSKYYDMYPLGEITLPTVPADDLDDLPPAGVKMAKPEGDHATILRTDNWKYAVQAYLASITFADAQVGRLLDALEAGPHNDNTIVVLWGDHGWHLGEKEHWRKFALWEEATRAPLFIAAPGVTTAGTRCDRPVDFLEIYPTICDLCGLTVPDHVAGESLRPWLVDPSADRDKPAITTHGRGNHAVRTERYRYIRYANGDEELYDHTVDPNEWTNIAQRAGSQSVIDTLKVHLPKTEAAEAPFDESKRGGGKIKAKRLETSDAKANQQKKPKRRKTEKTEK